MLPRRPPGDWPDALVEDRRTGTHRAPAHAYRSLIERAEELGLVIDDRARQFEACVLDLSDHRDPFPHQAEALEAWRGVGHRGVVEMPTGSGKTHVAILAIHELAQPTLIVVPTIDLMMQWHEVLSESFGVEIGRLGGGYRDRQVLTVSTYDSAAAQTEFIGARFGFLVLDECHHLAAPGYQFVAEGSIAPHRLGLTATFERPDGRHQLTEALVGPVCHRVDIASIEGRYLAEYRIETIEVELLPNEQEQYEAHRARYLDFLRSQGINFRRRDGWQQFIMRCQQSESGRAAFASYRAQKRIALTSTAKIRALFDIMLRHRSEPIIVFTQDNDTVSTLSRQFLLPSITHLTKPAERKRLLSAFGRGELPVLLTSKVLNEGVDVPEASVAVVLSGSSSVREHVQRLGRILRRRPGKQAVLYEICTQTKAEAGIRERRRRHEAYQREDRSEC